MDREGFRNRFKQYKLAREENPGLKYWEWKAQPAENVIPKYDEGTNNITPNDDVKTIGDVKLNLFSGIFSPLNLYVDEYATKKAKEIFGDLSISEIRKRMYNNMWPYSYRNPIRRLTVAVKDNKKENKRVGQGNGRDDIFAEYLQIPHNERHESHGFPKVVDSQYLPTVGKTNTKYKTLSSFLPPYSEDVEQLLTRLHYNRDRYTKFEYLPFGANKTTTALRKYFGEHTVGRLVDPNRGEYISVYDLWDIAPFFDGRDETQGIGKPVPFYDRIYLDDYYNVNSAPNKGDYYGGYLPEVKVTPKKYDEGGKVIPTQEEYITQQIDAKKAAALAAFRNATEPVLPTINGLPNVNSCIYTALNMYDKKYATPSNWTFYDNPGKHGFKQKELSKALPSDLIQVFDKNKPYHMMMLDGYDEQGHPLYNYSRGMKGDSSDIVKAKTNFPNTKKLAYEFVGTPADSTQWINDYKKIYGFAEGTDGVTGPPTYEQWYADVTKYNPTILDDASLYWSIEEAKKDLHKQAMGLPGYAPMWHEYVRSLPKADPDINQFVDDLWANENPNNVGYRNGKYYPHKSPEGGKMTIGPGFKLDSGSHGISTKTANRGMTKTRLDQEARKIGKQHLKAVDQFINYGQTTNPADTVSPQIKMGLMDLRHLVGPLNEWGNLRQAVLKGDLDRIKKESTVTWNDNGKIKVDKRRKKIRDEKYFYYE